MVFSKVGLLTALAKLTGFRHARRQRHVLASVICGVLSGHYGVAQIVQWLHAPVHSLNRSSPCFRLRVLQPVRLNPALTTA